MNPLDPRFTRRQVLGAAGALALGGAVAGSAAWWKRNERGWRADVFIGTSKQTFKKGLSSLSAVIRKLEA